MKKKQETVVTEPTREEHVKMMQSPDNWPRWPVLPLVRKSDTVQLGEEGFIFDSGTDKFTVYRANIFMVPKDFEIIPKDVYQSFEEIFDAGWRVD